MGSSLPKYRFAVLSVMMTELGSLKAVAALPGAVGAGTD